MQAAGSQADHGVSRFDAPAIQEAGFLHHPDNRSAQVVFAGAVKAGHLRRFAADERAMILRASARKAADQFGKDARLQLSRADIIQKEKRFRPEDRDVIDAMVDQVLADSVMAVHGEGDFELGPHAIRAGNQHRLPELFGVERKQPAEPANLAEHLTAMGGRQQPGQTGLDLVSEVNIDTGSSVSFLFHCGAQVTCPALR